MSSGDPGTLHVLVTRPRAQVGAWVERLRGHGFAASALPLLEIEPLADRAPIDAAWRDLRRCALVVFVSPNAVLQFFAARPADAAWPEATIAAAPGPGTAEALRDAGVAQARIVAAVASGDGKLDSEALWARLAGDDWRGRGVLVVRGAGGREWLIDRLRAAGAQVEVVAVYRRAPPDWSSAETELAALAAREPERHVWLFSSAEAIANLEPLMEPDARTRARAVATHPRIAARAREAGFERVVEAAPGFDGVVACLQSLAGC